MEGKEYYSSKTQKSLVYPEILTVNQPLYIRATVDV